MKNFLIDLCLVGLLLFMINGLFGDYGIQKAVFDKNITQFEEDVKEQKPITTDYGTTNDNEENTLSLVVKQISEVCIKVIETLVHFYSKKVMVYIMKDAKIIFMGTASFSKQVLEKLLENNYNVVAVVTQPDRFVGRKKVLTMPEVKEVALASGIPVYQPLKIKEEYQEIIALEPDLIITAAYGQIVPEAVLNAPKIGCINVHASLLPKYRGGAPVHYAIMEGEEVTGVTIMYMVKKMDAGNIISQVEVPIGAEETTGELYERLSIAGAELLLETLPSVLAGTNESIAQDESLVTYSPTISHEQEKIDFSKSALRVYNQVRGMNPWPGAYTTYQGKVVKIWAGKIHVCENALKHHAHQENGTIVKIFKDAIGVKTGEGIYLITELQLAGKKRMLVKDYLNGNNIFEVDSKFE